MSEAKKAGELPQSALSYLLGISATGQASKGLAKDVWGMLLNADILTTLNPLDIDRQIPPGWYGMGSAEDYGTPPNTDNHWQYGALLAVQIRAEQLQVMVSYYGGVAYRRITSKGNVKSWIMLSGEKF